MTVTDDAHAARPRLATGSAGLDTILHGGLLPHQTYLLSGAPGTGKTTLANQVCFHQIQAGARAVYVTLLAESHSQLVTNLAGYTFFDPTAVGTAMQYFSGYTPLDEQGVAGLATWVREVVRQHQATVLVLDGFDTVKALADSDVVLKRFVHTLSALGSLLGCTMLLLSQPPTTVAAPELTMVDGVLTLTDYAVDVRRVRALEVTKLRGSAYLGGRHLYDLTAAGVTVYPRTEAVLRPAPDVDPVPPVRLGFAVPQFDAMLHGGVGAASSTLIFGATGSGKTLLGLHFLAAGAGLGQPSLYFGMFERPARVIAKAHAVGLPVQRYLDAGTLELVWQSPREAILDVYADRLLTAVRHRQVERVFIDGVDGLQWAAYGERVPTFLLALIDELRTLGVTTLVSADLHQVVGPTVEVPLPGLSALVDNVVFLRYVELHSQLYRLISLVKVRDSAYDPAIREFTIGPQGITVAATFRSAEGILTGVARPLPASASAQRQRRRPWRKGSRDDDGAGGGG